jgi:hypothetical protein
VTEVDSRTLPKVESANMITVATKDSSSVYSSWFGKSVVLLVAIRQCHLPMPCCIIGESVTAVRVRIKPGWEMDLRKELILAVEEYVTDLENWIN